MAHDINSKVKNIGVRFPLDVANRIIERSKSCSMTQAEYVRIIFTLGEKMIINGIIEPKKILEELEARVWALTLLDPDFSTMLSQDHNNLRKKMKNLKKKLKRKFLKFLKRRKK